MAHDAHTHAHEHADHAHARSHAPVRRPASLVLMGAWQRLVLAFGICALMWLMIWGAMA